MRYLPLLIMLFCVQNLSAQAKLTIKNDSGRKLYVKIMKSGYVPVFHDSIAVEPNSQASIGFTQSGSYFAKSMAVAPTDSVYQKTRSFRVTNGPRGYSEHTLVFTIKESSESATGNIRISRKEYETN